MGTATRSIVSPLGRSNVARRRPTGSGRRAISSSASAIAAIRASSSISRSINESGLLAADTVDVLFVRFDQPRRGGAQRHGCCGQRQVLRLGRRTDQLARCAARALAKLCDVGGGVECRVVHENAYHIISVEPSAPVLRSRSDPVRIWASRSVSSIARQYRRIHDPRNRITIVRCAMQKTHKFSS